MGVYKVWNREARLEKNAPINVCLDDKCPSSVNVCVVRVPGERCSRETRNIERFGFLFFSLRTRRFEWNPVFFHGSIPGNDRNILSRNVFISAERNRVDTPSINQNAFLARWIIYGGSATSALIVESVATNFLIGLHVYQPSSCSLSSWSRSATAFRLCTRRLAARARCSAGGRPSRPPTLARSRTPGPVRTDNETRRTVQWSVGNAGS